MKTQSARTFRFAKLFALATALIALCPHTTLAETDGPGGPTLPPLVCVVASDGTSIWANSAALQPNGSTTYTTTAVNWTNGATKIATWANISTSGVIHFSDGTVGYL
jgi:hypothetical protein